MAKYLLLIFVFLTGCTSVKNEIPVGELFISIIETESAHTGRFEKKNGFEFYIEEPPPNTLGPFLNGYRFKDGKIVEVFDHGSAGGDFIREIETIGFVPFDYDTEYKKAEIAARKDYPVIGGARDGSKWELRIKTDKGEFYLHKWNPEGTIEFLAPYNENFDKLNKLIKVLQRYYGSYHLYM